MGGQDALVPLNDTRRLPPGAIRPLGRRAARGPVIWQAGRPSAPTKATCAPSWRSPALFSPRNPAPSPAPISWPGAPSWNSKIWLPRRSPASLPRSRRCMTTCARPMRSRTTWSEASSAPRPRPAKAKRPRWATPGRAGCSMPRQRDSLKGKRGQVILSVLPYHALRREDLTNLLVKNFNQECRGVPHLRV